MNFSGFIAWWLKRTSDSLKLPQFEKKLLVTLDWILDVSFSKDPVHFERSAPVSPHAAAELKKSA